MSENKVKWHPYPEEKPTVEDKYTLTVEDEFGERGIDYATFTSNQRWAYIHPDLKVVAWAEKPEPYKPPKQIDNHPDAETARKYMENDPETLKKLGIFDK